MKLFFYSKEIEFSSDLPLGTAVQKLSSRAKESGLITTLFSAVSNSTLMGAVNSEKVFLHRIQPFIGNIFKPHFYGRFVEKENGVVLKGVFTMSFIAKIIIIVFFAFLAFAETMVILAVLMQGEQYSFLAASIGVGALFLGLLLFVKRFSRGDVEWISNEITSALGAE